MNTALLLLYTFITIISTAYDEKMFFVPNVLTLGGLLYKLLVSSQQEDYFYEPAKVFSYQVNKGQRITCFSGGNFNRKFNLHLLLMSAQRT